MSATNRRDFLRAFGLRAAQNARVAVPLLGAATPVGMARAAVTARSPELDGPTAVPPAEDLLEEPAPPVRCLSSAELHDLVHDAGLTSRCGELVPLARRSVRMSNAPSATCRAWLNLAGAAGLATEADLTTGRTSAVVLAQVAGGAPELADTALAGPGWCVLSAEPAGAGVLDVRATQVEEVAQSVSDMQPVALAAHLMLPRVWNDAVQVLHLDEAEQDAYVRLRERVAEQQGVVAEGAAAPRKAYHRLLGYPEETTGSMPAACVDAAGPGDWTLLVQITASPRRRLYVWTADQTLDRLVGFVR